MVATYECTVPRLESFRLARSANARFCERTILTIRKFLTFKAPVQAVLSDKTTRIGARISSSATREYEEKEKRAFTKGTAGGLIQITEFEIVATHLGPRSDRLTLLVNDFKLIGSNGSAVSSVPRPIESPDKGCFALLDRLIGMRAHEKACSSQGHSTRESSATTSSSHAHSQSVAISSNGVPNSQAVFATQNFRTQRYHSPQRQNGAGQGLNHEAPGDARGPKPKSNISTHASDLVSILERINGTKQGFGLQIAEDKLSTSDVIEKVDTAEVPSGGHVSKFVGDATISLSEQHLDQDPSTLIPIDTDLHLKKSSPISRCITDGESMLVSRTDDVSSFSSAKKRKLNDRIRSRDVTISEHQSVLLNRQDSWRPAEPGQRAPKANVPIDLLEAFSQFADQNVVCDDTLCPDNQEALNGDTVHSSQNGTINASISSSGGESDIDSEKWPDSPNRAPSLPGDTPPAVRQVNRHSKTPTTCKSPPLRSPPHSTQRHHGLQSPSQRTQNYVRREVDDRKVAEKVGHQVAFMPRAANSPPRQAVPRTPQDVELLPVSSIEKFLQNEVDARQVSKDEVQDAYGKQVSEPLPSSASTADSDIAMSIPMPLYKSLPSPAKIMPYEAFPSTAVQANDPFTQVKRTPCTVADTGNSADHIATKESPSTMDGEYQIPRGTFDERCAQSPSTASTFVSKTDSVSLFRDTASKNDSVLPSNAMLKDPGAKVSNSETFEKAISVPRGAGETSVKQTSKSNYKCDNLKQGETCDPADPSAAGPATGSSGLSIKKPISTKRALQALNEEGKPNAKRGKTKPSFIYQRQAHRSGKIPSLPALDISNTPDDLPDPAISARQHRESWFAARRSSESSAARESPTSATKVDALSMSSPPGRSTHNTSGIATPLDLRSPHTVHGKIFTSGSSTPVIGGRAGSRNASFLSGNGSGIRLTGQIPSAVEDFPTSIDINPKATFDIATSSPDEKQQPRQREMQTRRRPAESKILPSGVQSSKTGRTTTLAGTSANDLDISVPTSYLRRGGTPENGMPPDRSLKTSLIPTIDVSGRSKSVSPVRSLFTLFQNAYPQYRGDMKHFLTLCKKIETLWKRDSLHKSMWDDFIIRHKDDYARYVGQCMEDGDDPMTYEKFYNDKIDETIYQDRVITPSTLDIIIKGSNDTEFSPFGNIATTSMPVATISSHSPASTDDAAQAASKRTHEEVVTIDLTDDDQRDARITAEDDILQSEAPKPASSRRHVPWKANHNAQPNQPSNNKCSSMPNQVQLNQLGLQSPSRSATRKQSNDDKTHLHRPGQRPPTVRAASNNLQTPSRDQSITEQKDTGAKYQMSKTSSVENTGRLDNSSADARLEGQNRNSVPSWWQDENTPFKTFARSYLAIRPGNGNSFAKPEDVARDERRYQNTVRKIQQLDVLGWELGPKRRAEAP